MISHRTARAYAAFTSSCGPFVLAIAAAERLLARLFITHLRAGGGRVVAECDTYRSKALDNYPGTNYLAAVAPSESEKVFPQDGWISVHSRKETPGAAKPHSQLACSSLDPNNGCARR